jgi:hypothetical protein
MHGLPPPTRIRICMRTRSKRPGAKRSSAMSPVALSILAEAWLKGSSTPAMETRWSCGNSTGSAVP